MSIGVDIGSKTIKVVELAQEKNALSLKSAGIVGHTYGEVDRFQDDKEYANLAGALKKLIHDSKISSKNVAISLPEAQVFTRIVRFPMLSDQEVASAIRWEAEEYIPIPLKEAVVQHQIIERNETASPPEVVVLLVAAPKTLVEKYVRVVSSAGLNVVGVEPGLMSIVRAVAPQTGTSMIIEFGARSTDLAIAKNGEIRLSRSIPTAGDAFTRAVAQSMGVAEQQAEEYKRAYGLAPDQLEGKIGTALSPIFRIVSEEIKKALHYYQNEESKDLPTSLILSGGTAGLPGIVPTLTRLLGMEVSVGNPFSKVTVNEDLKNSLQNYIPLYSIAVGLALRNDQ